MDNSTEKNEVTKKRSLAFRLFRFLGRLVVLFLVLSVIITLLFQNTRFQNWLGQKITKKFSEDLNTTIHFEHIDFEIFDKLVLNNFLLEDLDGDTLLYSKELKVNLTSGLWDLFNNELSISDLDLTEAKFVIHKMPGASKTNLDLLLEKIIKPKEDDKKGSSKPFYIDADVLRLHNVVFEQKNEEKGEDLRIHVVDGFLKIDLIDLVEKSIVIEEVDFDIANVDFNQYHGTASKEELNIEESEPDSLPQPFKIKIHDFDLDDATFSLYDLRKSDKKTTPRNQLDWSHFEAFNIDLMIDSLVINTDLDFTGRLRNLSFEESSGFVLNELSAKQAKVTSRRTELYGMNLITPNSTLGDTLIFKYRTYEAFKEFQDEVIMDLKFDNSKVAVKDVMVFAPKLKTNKFFANNVNELLQIEGNIRGKINSLKGRELDIKLGKSTRLKGKFSSRDLVNKGEEYLNFDLENLNTSMLTLRQLVPEFNPPQNYNKLGNINFSGSFTGFFVDFVAYGDLKTDLGRAVMDMRLDLKPGRDKAGYSGSLNLQNFDLENWTNNKDLGNITFTSKITNGIGLTGSTANAKIDANVDNFTFRDYTYQDFKMDGKLNQNLFDGKFIIQDKNIDLAFDGSIDFQDSIPIFNFIANVNTLNLDELNLSKQDISVTGDVALSIVDKNISTLYGDAQFKNLKITKNGTEEYLVDTMNVESKFNDQLDRVLTVQSDVVDLSLEGDFDIQEIPDVFTNFILVNYPEFAERLGLRDKQKVLASRFFDFDIHLKDSKNFTDLVDTKLDTIKNLTLKGSYDGMEYALDMDLKVDQFLYDNVQLGGIKLSGSALKSVGRLSSLVPFYAIIGNQKIPELTLAGKINRDTFLFDFGLKGERGTIDDFHIGGRLYIEDSEVNINLANKDLMLFGEEWTIEKSNFIRLGRKTFNADDFILQNRDRQVSIKNIGEKGLRLQLDNFNTGFIDTLWNYSRLDFAGNYSVDIQAEDVFSLQNLSAAVVSDTFLINGDDFGKFQLTADADNINDIANINLNIRKEGEVKELNIDGFYVLPNAKNVTLPGESQITSKSNFFDLDLKLTEYPLNITEYFIDHILSEMEGVVNLETNFSGSPKDFNMDGDAEISDGLTKVNYLNTKYYFGRGTPAKVKISNTMFDFSGNKIYDKYDNEGSIEGGLTHDRFKRLGFNARMQSNRFLVLDTDKKDNPIYYGHGIGEVDITFTGLNGKPNCFVNATSGEGSYLSIPINYDKTTSTNEFIIFINKEEKQEPAVSNDVRGLDILMNVNVTEDAEVSLIFDEQTGDVIRGRGNGPLQLKVPRGDEIQLFGDYVVKEGTYLFTLYNFVNKKFQVREGGTIKWDGDPFNAEINVEAEYNQISAPVYNFIEEYIELASSEEKEAARNSTDVQLKMDLTGELLQPDINFDLSFPELQTGGVKNYVDNKLRTLHQDQNALNRQVFGLIVMGGFLPSGQAGLAGAESNLVANTVSEYLSSQLSLYITGLLNEALSEVGFISGVNFNVAYRVNNTDIGEGPITGSEFKLRSGIAVKNKWTFDGSLVRSESTNSADPFIGGDFRVEWTPKADGRFSVRIYQESDQALEGGRKNKTGIGVTYRREFDTFEEFIDGLKRSAKKIAKKSKPNG